MEGRKDCDYQENVLRLQKRQRWQINLIFFCEKPKSKPERS